MGKFLAVFLAYMLICNDYQIFRNPTELSKGPMISIYIFLTAVFLLLYDLRLYPKHLRQLDRMSQNIFEFFIAMFAMEIILLDFWYPLGNGAKAMCLQAAQKLEETSSDYDYIVKSLRNPSTHGAVICTLSVFFLMAVLHAIRAVDFRALEEGPSCFYGDIKYRSRRFLCRRLRALGFRKKRVKIKECEEIRSKRKHTDTLEDNDINDNNKTMGSDIDLDDLSKYDDLTLDCDGSIDGDSLKFGDFDIPDDTDLLLSDD